MTHKPDTSGIVYVTNELLQAKDFTKEVRGQMDVEQFASQGQIMLDTRADLNLDQVLGLMLNRVSFILSDGQSIRASTRRLTRSDNRF